MKSVDMVVPTDAFYQREKFCNTLSACVQKLASSSLLNASLTSIESELRKFCSSMTDRAGRFLSEIVENRDLRLVSLSVPSQQSVFAERDEWQYLLIVLKSESAAARELRALQLSVQDYTFKPFEDLVLPQISAPQNKSFEEHISSLPAHSSATLQTAEHHPPAWAKLPDQHSILPQQISTALQPKYRAVDTTWSHLDPPYGEAGPSNWSSSSYSRQSNPSVDVGSPPPPQDRRSRKEQDQRFSRSSIESILNRTPSSNA